MTVAADVAGRGRSESSSWSELLPSEKRIEATFCTVVTPLHKRIASFNYQMVKILNEGCAIHWNVVDNHDYHLNDKRKAAFLRKVAKRRGEIPPEPRDNYAQTVKEFFDTRDITEYMPGANVFTGLTLDETFEYFARQLESTPDETEEHRRLLRKYLASYHHASGLNLALEQVRTRYAVIIDPDLYVVRPGWLRDVIDHMTEHDLAVFGAPWNPRWYQKFRYFPCAHLMVIDLQKCPWRRDLLAPDLVRPGAKYISTFWLGFPEVRRQGRWRSFIHLLRNAVRAIEEDIHQRATIERSRDTGYSLLQHFRSRGDLKADTVVPVCAPRDGFEPATVSTVQRRVDGFLPDRWSYLPKRSGYMSREGFDAYGYPDCRSLGWEEFLWKGEPFAFHVRGERRRVPIGRSDDVKVLKRLNTILRRMGRPRIPDKTPAAGT
jgi:hypothetical protein